MSDQDSPIDWLQQWRQGDEDAARKIFERYAIKLLTFAEGHLANKIARREDEEDVVQSVFRTFFRRISEDKLAIDNAESLWHLLVKITLLKTRAKARQQSAAKRNVDAEQSLPTEDWIIELTANAPGPAEIAVFVDQIEYLLHDLPEMYGEVLQMRLQGYGRSEIAQQLDISRQTVYRVLQLLQQRLDQALTNDH